MRIKDAARASGLTVDQIRLYERRGVLPAAPRDPNGYRAYAGSHLSTLRLAKGLREAGLSLKQISPILRGAQRSSCADLRAVLLDGARTASATLDARIASLRRTRAHVGAIETRLRAMDPERDGGESPCTCCVNVVAAGRGAARR